MRDKFVGDVGDFGKYGLLRALCGDDLRLGVVWYFVRDRTLDYLNDENRFESCDPQLFAVLKGVVNNCQRKIASIEASRLFPNRAVFFPEEVPKQLEKRNEWLDHALKKTRDCDLVFLDPDNGLAGVPLGEGSISAEHAYYEELEPFVRRGQSLIAWHQPGFLQEAVPLRLAEVRSRFPGYAIDVLTYHRVMFRALFVISGRTHRHLLAERIDRFLQGPWGKSRSKREKPHFQRVS
jgi:hypothetical protein